MYPSRIRPLIQPRIECDVIAETSLFAWQGAGIVLMAERAGANWMLARAWRSGDRLTDVRRWVFTESDRFVSQVRRLVLDATNSSPMSIDAAHAAAGWVTVQQDSAS